MRAAERRTGARLDVSWRIDSRVRAHAMHPFDGTKEQSMKRSTVSKIHPAPRGIAADPKVQAFLDRFAKAITSGDAATIAAMWATPAYVLSDDAAHALSSREEVAEFFAGGKDQYNARGIVSTRAEILSLEWATKKLALVTVRWPYLDAKGKEVGEESSTYTLRSKENGELEMCVALMRGAKESLE
jgi:hypothetical protein